MPIELDNGPAPEKKRKVTSAELLSVQMKSTKVDNRDELQRYLDDKPVDAECMSGSVLNWWKVWRNSSGLRYINLISDNKMLILNCRLMNQLIQTYQEWQRISCLYQELEFQLNDFFRMGPISCPLNENRWKVTQHGCACVWRAGWSRRTKSSSKNLFSAALLIRYWEIKLLGLV